MEKTKILDNGYVAAQGPVDVLVGRLFGLKVPVTSSHWKFEFSEAMPGPVFRLCATIYSPTQPPPYNESTWDSKDEREACAELCEWLPVGTGYEGKTFAEAIRGVGYGGNLAQGFKRSNAK